MTLLAAASLCRQAAARLGQKQAVRSMAIGISIPQPSTKSATAAKHPSEYARKPEELRNWNRTGKEPEVRSVCVYAASGMDGGLDSSLGVP